MDRCGIERVVLSLTQPGIQGIPDRRRAAKRMNDDQAEHFLAAHPKTSLSGDVVLNCEFSIRMKNGEVRTGLGSAELIEINGEPCVLAVTAI
jgi:hypothetical protein